MIAQKTYRYKARDRSGSVVTGSLVATSAQEVSTRLRSEGKFLLAVDDRPMNADSELNPEEIRRSESAKRVRREDVISFCQQLSVMLETGVPLADALDSFHRQTPRREFRQVIHTLRDDIHTGIPFSTSMQKWPRVFPSIMISLMKASEASGTMSMMLGRIGDYLQKERRTIKQVKGALSYPAFMVIFAIVISVFLFAFVLPKFARIYEGRGAALPLPTQIMMGLSDFIMTQYLYYVPVLAVLGFGAWMLAKSEPGKRGLDWFRLNCPVLRTMYRQLYITRMARTMSTLLAAGVGLLDIIDICRGVTDNKFYDDLWDKMSKGVHDGRQMSEMFTRSSFIPPNVVSMIAAGEQSGRLAEVMGRIAEFSEEELDASIKQVTAMIEPIMIITMGAIIGGVAISLLLPVFSMGNVMAGG